MQNPARAKLAAGGPVLLMSLRQLRTPDAAMIVKEAGFDGFYVDREHGTFSDAETAALCTAGLLAGLLTAVRVRANTGADIAIAMDAGALCVIVPHVSTVAEAEAAVRAAKYPPMGARSQAALGPMTFYRSIPSPQAIASVNEVTMVFAMLETEEGVANAAAIAAVPGVDALMIGPSDLSNELGIPGETRHARIRDAFHAAASAARAAGKHMVAGGAGGPDIAEMAGLGARILMGGNDVAYLMGAARKAAETMRKDFGAAH
ncbi:aldolase/citrate lyase family protein [Roseomonas sp. AR75]|uniref:aldolase/citrate lyase family protein n=1 Tax=Roseomonas sp. AR75 TaxID=2562311 RepID=UPI0010C0FE64|nr:aldolase/citrate lyase family protein [Roseomonas sp. AR75]